VKQNGVWAFGLAWLLTLSTGDASRNNRSARPTIVVAFP